MKKYFVILLSAMMLSACGGNKAQGNASADFATENVEEVATEHNQELLWGFVSIGNDQLDTIEEYDHEEFCVAQKFLMEVLNPDDGFDTYSEEWITAHCSAEMKQFLRDRYDYDGEGYAKWLMEGRFAGEDEYDTEVKGFSYGNRQGKPVYAIEKHLAFEGLEPFTRTLYFGLKRKGDDFIITSFEMNLEPNDPTVKFL